MSTRVRVIIVSTVLILGVAVVAVAMALSRTPATPSPAASPGATGSGPALIAEDTHLLSDAGEGAVTVVEFADIECEACGAMFPYVEELVEEFGDRVTVAVRYFPLSGHLNGLNAAIATESAARQGSFEPMFTRLMESQSEWGEAQTSQAELFRTHAAELGLDMERFDADVADPSTEERVRADFEAGRALGVNGTPTFFIDGERIELRAFGDLRAAVERALAAR